MTVWSRVSTTRLAAYLNGSWVDLRPYLLIDGKGDPIQGTVGRSTELTQTDPTSVTFVLNNRDGRFTPNNPLGAYYPYWTSGVQLRWSETIGPRTFTFPDVWVEVGEVSLSFEVADSPTRSDRVLRVNAVDLLTRLQRAPRFLSVLAAHIMGNGTALAVYWPFSDAAGTRRVACVKGSSANALAPELLIYGGAAYILDDLFSFATTDGPFGDDATYPLWDSAAGVGVDLPDRVSWAQTALTGVTLTGATMVALSAWVYFATSFGAAQTSISIDKGSTSPHATLQLDTTTGAPWIFTFGNSPLPGGTFILTSESAPRLRGWSLVTGYVDLTTHTASLWVNDLPAVTTAVTGTVTGSMAQARVDGPQAGSVGHVQLYVGSPTDYNRAAHLAQYTLGMIGLAGQSVNERIGTIANYAGVTDAQLDLEESDSVMPAAAFAAQRPGDLAAAAAVTGGGVLFTRDTHLVYQDRKHRFDL